MAGLITTEKVPEGTSTYVVAIKSNSAPLETSLDEMPSPSRSVAWTQAILGHLIFFNTWGFINSFGVFQEYYTSSLNRSQSDISWVGSCQIFLVFFMALFSGRAMDAGYHQYSIIIGCALQVLAMIATSFSTAYWHLFLAQGLCQGLGDGLLYCPTIWLISVYFKKKKALAVGITASGAATGGMVFPVIAQKLLPQIGFSWTVRVMALITLANAVVILIFLRSPKQQRKSKGGFIEWTAFKELPYVLFLSGTFLCLMGIYFAYFYVSTYATEALGVSSSMSISLLLIMNGVGIPGRVVTGLISDNFFGPLDTLIFLAFCSGLLIYCWIGIHSIAGLIVFGVIYGFFGAGFQGLFPAALLGLTKDPEKVGVRTGMAFSILGIACLTGPPIAGALIQNSHGAYVHAQIFGGSTILAGTICLVGARIVISGYKR